MELRNFSEPAELVVNVFDVSELFSKREKNSMKYYVWLISKNI